MNKPELLRQIATAMEQDPGGWWRGFEYRTGPTERGDQYAPELSASAVFESLAGGQVVRPRPRTIRIDVEVPEPMREVPEVGQRYWLMAPQKESGYRSFTWLGDDFDREAFKQGIWPTEAEAQQAADAIFGALGDHQ